MLRRIFVPCSPRCRNLHVRQDLEGDAFVTTVTISLPLPFPLPMPMPLSLPQSLPCASITMESDVRAMVLVFACCNRFQRLIRELDFLRARAKQRDPGVPLGLEGHQTSGKATRDACSMFLGDSTLPSLSNAEVHPDEMARTRCQIIHGNIFQTP